MKKIFALLVLTIAISACGGTYFAKATLATPSKKKDILAAITSVLQDSGYVVEMANGSVGIINTAWKVKNKFLYSDRTKMSFSINTSENTIRMTPIVQRKGNSGDSDWGEINVKKNDEYFNSILKKIASVLNNKIKVIWALRD